MNSIAQPKALNDRDLDAVAGAGGSNETEEISFVYTKFQLDADRTVDSFELATRR